MMTIDERVRFFALRARVRETCDLLNEEGYPGKDYEGEMTLEFVYPGVHSKKAPYVYITLGSYLIGPERHMRWKGQTVAEALDAAEKDIDKWLAEVEA